MNLITKIKKFNYQLSLDHLFKLKESNSTCIKKEIKIENKMASLTWI